MALKWEKAEIETARPTQVPNRPREILRERGQIWRETLAPSVPAPPPPYLARVTAASSSSPQLQLLPDFSPSPAAFTQEPSRHRHGLIERRRRHRRRPGASPEDLQARAPAQGEEALRQGRPAVPRLRPRRRL